VAGLVILQATQDICFSLQMLLLVLLCVGVPTKYLNVACRIISAGSCHRLCAFSLLDLSGVREQVGETISEHNSVAFAMYKNVDARMETSA